MNRKLLFQDNVTVAIHIKNNVEKDIKSDQTNLLEGHSGIDYWSYSSIVFLNLWQDLFLIIHINNWPVVKYFYVFDKSFVFLTKLFLCFWRNLFFCRNFFFMLLAKFSFGIDWLCQSSQPGLTLVQWYWFFQTAGQTDRHSDRHTHACSIIL